MNNNKGQSLVSFVLLLPLLFLVLFMVYEIGRMSLLKNNLDSINYLAMDYGLDNIDDEKLITNVENYIKKNNSDIDNIVVSKNEDKLYITLGMQYVDSISLFKNAGLLRVKSSYVGYYENEKKIIKENGR